MNMEETPKQIITVGSLFAGIGGIELGLEWAQNERYQFKTVWQVECDPYAQAVLKKHWPDVGRWDDVRTFPPAPAEYWRCDVICGGFPCTDISTAGKMAGINGEHSGLWSEYIRTVRAIQPRFVIVENVAALLGLGMGRVLGDLAASGYDAEWECLPAAAFGAPHIRDRVFILAYPESLRARLVHTRSRRQNEKAAVADGSSAAAPLPCDSKRRGLQGGILRSTAPPAEKFTSGRRTSLGTYIGEAWPPEPREDWLDDGLSGPLAEACSRLVGNAVVPQVAQWIGERILEAIRDNE